MEPQELERRRPGVVEHEQPVAEAIGPAGNVPTGEAGPRVQRIGVSVAKTVHQSDTTRTRLHLRIGGIPGCRQGIGRREREKLDRVSRTLSALST
jgi:hypothetical protein